jgi:phosphohistidine phosphatase
VRLLLLRHATAVPSGTPGYDDDAQRPLTEKGEREARHAGLALQRLGVELPALVTSPYVRSRDTAVLAAAALEAEVVEEPALESGFDLDELPGVIERHRYDPLLLIGHDPDFSLLVEALTGANVQMAKGGLATIELDDGPRRGAGELRSLLRPKQLRAIAEGATE